jgi:hypothetical protein
VFEHFSEPLLSKAQFRRRQIKNIGRGLFWILVVLTSGALGYRYYLHGASMVDSFQAAAMILSGMGPDAHPETSGGKIFATIYALFSGLFYPAVLGYMAAPRIHRSLHKFHLKDREARATRA